MRTLLALFFTLAALGAYAQDAVKITAPWARATPGGAKNGAAYMTLESASPDALVAVSSPIADRLELHTHVQDAGVMKMMPIEQVTLDPGKQVEMKPGGIHVMMMGLKRPLTEGEMFPLTLTFKSGKREVEVRVEKPGASAPSQGGHKH